MHHTIVTTGHQGPGFIAGGILLLFLFLCGPLEGTAQDVSFSGFIKSEYIYDTRQIVGARESNLFLYPASDPNPDRDDDAEDADNLLFFPFFSRLRIHVDDLPEALGAEVTGFFETDFYGPNNATLNTLRIRRLFAKMVWDNREVLFGMEWSPLFSMAVAPQTVAPSTGAPFQPFARHPQILYTAKTGNLRLMGALSQQRDAFVDAGPEGPGAKPQQLATIPGAHFHVQYVDGATVVGGGAHYKWLRPFPTGNRFGAGAVQAYAKVGSDALEVRGKATFGGSLRDHLMMSGYVTRPDGEDEYDFKALNVVSGWLDVHRPGAVSPGIYVGYLQNLGTADDGLDAAEWTFFARDPNIDYAWRLAPRLALNYGQLRFALEADVTSALYASELDDAFAPDAQDADEAVTNVRTNFSVFLFF
ncbi:MAG: hypothetical protein GVY18_01340 [Bacteroidetes bacterium]|jgi:hypothetical protein|nr:hypothetical protein [Bacteroidota bacterium]